MIIQYLSDVLTRTKKIEYMSNLISLEEELWLAPLFFMLVAYRELHSSSSFPEVHKYKWITVGN